MKFSGKMCFKMILKVRKKHGFTLSREDTLFEKPPGVQIDPLPPVVLGLMTYTNTVKLSAFCVILKDLQLSKVNNLFSIIFTTRK